MRNLAESFLLYFSEVRFSLFFLCPCPFAHLTTSRVGLQYDTKKPIGYYSCADQSISQSMSEKLPEDGWFQGRLSSGAEQQLAVDLNSSILHCSTIRYPRCYAASRFEKETPPKQKRRKRQHGQANGASGENSLPPKTIPSKPQKHNMHY